MSDEIWEGDPERVATSLADSVIGAVEVEHTKARNEYSATIRLYVEQAIESITSRVRDEQIRSCARLAHSLGDARIANAIGKMARS